MDLLHAAPFQGIIPRPYLKGTANKLLDISPKAPNMKQHGGRVLFRKLHLIRSPGLLHFRKGFYRTAYKRRGLYPRGHITGITKVLRNRLKQG